MKKYILGAGIGALLMLGGTVLAGSNTIPYRTIFVTTKSESYEITKFVDPDNGNVCYLSEPATNSAYSISCLKNN